jgi:hypothetical protein
MKSELELLLNAAGITDALLLVQSQVAQFRLRSYGPS